MPVISTLSHAECEKLLVAGVFGRVGFTGPRGPEIVPVNYAVVDDAILIRTDPTSALATHAHRAPLVLEVDLVDHERWQGWSVIARGVGECLVAGDEPSASGRPRTWAAGDRTTLVRLAWTELSGRRLGSGRDEFSAMPVRQVLR